MQAKNYYSLNGKFFLDSENTISVNNRSFRYGDGFFETIKLINGNIQLKELHFERIATSLATLGFTKPKHFSFTQLEQQIVATAIKNKHQQQARIRINFFRKDAELFNIESNDVEILIQSFELQPTPKIVQQNGLIINVYPFAKRSCDVFSNIKSNNYLPYSMAAIWAKQNKLNDALVLNCNNNIADSCIANIFIIKNKKIITPNLKQGCVNGVMRKHIIATLSKNKIKVFEKKLTATDIENADEVFLTNAIKGIVWVKQFREKTFTKTEILKIEQLIFNQ